MDQKLYEVLQGQEGNYIFPFYWQHGDHTELIPEQMRRIRRSGCRAVCIESRPHPDFCGEGWWRDFSVILEEARKLDMKVWLLDDDKFPTGHAAGMIASKYPQLRQWLLVERHVDVVGPAESISVIVDPQDEENLLLGAFAYRRNADEGETCAYEGIDVTDRIHGNYLTWDVPEGVWRLFFYYKSRKGARNEYIDVINPESVRVLIDAVYESHFEHFGEYFGNTFVGFFSDEPGFENQVFGEQRFDYGFYEARIGKPSLALPWNEQVLERLEQALGFDPIPHLNLLWYEDDTCGDDQARIRFAYMNIITRMYSECFTQQLAQWCHGHGVAYIGHIIEDMNCHMRSGVGHYFRALQAQDMSGIDIVLHQVMPGMSRYVHTASGATGVYDGTFFHYILGKLAASLAHLTPHMQGRAMCEVFGAYGYGEDSVLMKYLIDFLLVRGVNHFVPHAFSSRFPDPDCPPHFGAEGQDPSFEAFSALMRYTNKASHLLQDARHVANAAILYYAENEWSSRFMNAMNMQPAAQALYDSHIDYDIVSMDMLEQAQVCGGKLTLAPETFDVLIIPYADHMPREMLEILKGLQAAGLPLVFLDALPENADFAALVLHAEDLPQFMQERGMTDVLVDGYPDLRIYHCVREDRDVFMFANEDVAKRVKTQVKLPVKGAYIRVDLLAESYTCGNCEDGLLALDLMPNQSQIVIFGDSCDLEPEYEITRTVPIQVEFELALAECENLTHFEKAGRFDHFFPINAPDFQPDFSGKMKYDFDFETDTAYRHIFLDLGNVGQNAMLFVNGKDCGIRITKPYRFEITQAVQEGRNHCEVVVSNTLVHKVRDMYSHFLQLSPSGLLGGMTLQYGEKK